MNTYRDNLKHSYAADFLAWYSAGMTSAEPTVPQTLTYQEGEAIRIGARRLSQGRYNNVRLARTYGDH